MSSGTITNIKRSFILTVSGRVISFISILLAASILLFATSARLDGLSQVTVMTQNIYVGADIGNVITAPPDQVPIVAALEFQRLLNTNFPERAQALAKEVARNRPHLIGLQEVVLIRIQSPGDFLAGITTPNATYVLFDYLEILLDELNALGLDYEVAGLVQNADVEVPMLANLDPPRVDDVRVTDYDVILARHDVETSNVRPANYSQMLTVSGIDILRGFVAVDAKVGKRMYRFVNTHLEAFHGGVNYLQGLELVSVLANETLPVIVVGDFNSPAPDGATYNVFLNEGYEDVWLHNLLRNQGPGLTSSQDPDLLNEESELYQRVDLIFVRTNGNPVGKHEIGPVQAIVVGDEQQDRTPSGLWPSDHAGVIARLHIPYTEMDYSNLHNFLKEWLARR